MRLQQPGGGRAEMVAQVLALLCGPSSPPGMQRQQGPRRACNSLGEAAGLQGRCAMVRVVKKDGANQ